jgi:hypothetical protein
MNYLDIVNSVLKRLREQEVSTVNQTSYSTLISMLVNDAKDEVENAWKWSALRTTLTATTTSGIFAYSLTGSDGVFEILDVLNDTSDFRMKYMNASEMTDKYLLHSTVQTGSPEYYSFNGVDANGDAIVEVYPKPDGVYTLRFNMVKRTGDLVNDTDTNTLPDHPIIMLAYAKAVEERGEDGGIAASSAYATAQKHLSDYIALDASRHPEELIWATV